MKKSLFSGKGPIVKRMQRLWQLRDLSPTAQKSRFMSLDPGSFAVVEKIALKEARENAHSCGRLFESSYRNDAGNMIREYEGDPRAWMNHFKQGGYVGKINTECGIREETVKLKPGQRVQIVSK